MSISGSVGSGRADCEYRAGSPLAAYIPPLSKTENPAGSQSSLRQNLLREKSPGVEDRPVSPDSLGKSQYI